MGKCTGKMTGNDGEGRKRNARVHGTEVDRGVVGYYRLCPLITGGLLNGRVRLGAGRTGEESPR